MLLAGAVLLAVRRIRLSVETQDLQTVVPGSSPIAYLLLVPLVAAVWIAFRYSVHYAEAHPHGAWDSWAIWTMRARFLFRAGAQWRNAFSPVIEYSHPDYPILLPATIDRIWTYMQYEVLAVPTMLGLFFMFCTVGLSMSSVAVLRSKSQALLTGAVLLSTPFLVRHAVSGYAEPPLMFFILATTVLLIMSDDEPRMLVLAGLAAGLAAWTKNEGLLFLVCVSISLAVLLFVYRGWSGCLRAVSLFVAGAFPVLVVIILFKSQVPVASWLFASGSGEGSILARLTDLSRYSTISEYYLREMLRFGQWRISMVPVLAAYSLLAGPSCKLRDLKQHPGLLTVTGTLALASVGYFFVYVITPAGLEWQLENSLNRVLLQLWPAAVVVFFCVVRTPDEALAPYPMP